MDAYPTQKGTCRNPGWRLQAQIARAEAAEAEVAYLRSLYTHQHGLYTHQHSIAQEEHARAEAAEARLERIRQALGGYADSDLASLAMSLRRHNDAAEAEVARLRAELGTVRDDVLRLIKTPHNHDMLMSDNCQRCAIEERLAAWAKAPNAGALHQL